MRKSTVPELRIPQTPQFVQLMPPAERARLADEVEAFFKTLPQGSREDAQAARGYIYSHLNELSHAQRTAFLVATPFRCALDDFSLFDEFSLAQGLDDLAKRGAFDAQALRKG